MSILHGGDSKFNLQYSEVEKVNHFQSVTSCPDDELPLIIKLLQNHSWNLEPALSRYFDGDWKDNLDNSHGSRIDETTAFGGGSLTPVSQGSMAFIDSGQSYIPSLPIVTPLPNDYMEKFQLVGLQPKRSVFNSSSLLAVMMFPSTLFKVGVMVFAFIFQIITFGYFSGPNDIYQKVGRLPSKFEGPVRSTDDDIVALLENESSRLLEFKSSLPFNELLSHCQANFKFMLIVFLGDMVGQDTDLNSQRFLKNILADKSTLSFFNENKDILSIYIGTANDKESWAVGKHMGVRYIPECFLVANVMNSNTRGPGASFFSTNKMSVLGNITISSLKRFERSLKYHMNKYTPELCVSRDEKKEIELARKIKQMQNEAYQESLQQDQLKEERRRIEEEEHKIAKLVQEQEDYNEKLQNTLANLFWLDIALKSLSSTCRGIKNEECAQIQIRMSDGKRMLKKFPSEATLFDLYICIGYHLYLEETSDNAEIVLQKICERINKLSSDDNIFCFKTDFESPISSFESMRTLINKELSKLDIKSHRYDDYVDFELVSPFPRYKIPLDESLIIKNVPQIWPNGNILVEHV